MSKELGDLLEVPADAGCLCRLEHRGSHPGSGYAGTDDPDRWQCLLWFGGVTWAKVMLNDMIGKAPRAPSLWELMENFRRYEGAGWRRVVAAGKLALGSGGPVVVEGEGLGKSRSLEGGGA